jgi:hypothetical protein
MAERRAGAYDQQLAQVTVAHLGDAPEPWLAAGRALAWRQAEEGGELAPAGEVSRLNAPNRLLRPVFRAQATEMSRYF